MDKCTNEKAECKNNYSNCNQTNKDLFNENKNLFDDLEICKNDLQICKNNDICRKKLVKSEADSKYYQSLLILFMIMFILSLIISITVITCLVQPTKEKWLAFYTYIKSCKPYGVKNLEKVTSESTKTELTSKKQMKKTHKISKKPQVTPLWSLFLLVGHRNLKYPQNL